MRKSKQLSSIRYFIILKYTRLHYPLLSVIWINHIVPVLEGMAMSGVRDAGSVAERGTVSEPMAIMIDMSQTVARVCKAGVSASLSDVVRLHKRVTVVRMVSDAWAIAVAVAESETKAVTKAKTVSESMTVNREARVSFSFPDVVRLDVGVTVVGMVSYAWTVAVAMAIP